MNLDRTIRRLARILTTALATGLACAAAPAALASPRPRPPGWNKHPPLPAHAHTLATGGLPGWQLTFIAITAILLATALAVTYRLRAWRRRAAATTAQPNHRTPVGHLAPAVAASRADPAAAARPHGR